MRLSLVCSSAFIPSYKTYKVSRGSVAILRLRPFNVLTVGLSASFDVTSAPSGRTIVFVIHTRNIYSTVVDPILRLVERVLT